MKIKINDPDTQYGATVDTHVSEVIITECYLGVRFEADPGERLVVCMRDGGFEIKYAGRWWSFLGGVVAPL